MASFRARPLPWSGPSHATPLLRTQVELWQAARRPAEEATIVAAVLHAALSTAAPSAAP
jgi:hypothetical protein